MEIHLGKKKIIYRMPKGDIFLWPRNFDQFQLTVFLIFFSEVRLVEVLENICERSDYKVRLWW